MNTPHIIKTTKTKGPRTLAKRGSGGLHGEQQYCFEMGYREGVAALRKAILERIEKETTITYENNRTIL